MGDNKDKIIINLSIVPNEKSIFLLKDNSSGFKYFYEDFNDLIRKIRFYLKHYYSIK